MGEVIFNQVGKSYGRDKWVIRDFSVTINDGEFCVLLGPSGCGKSTLLRMIAGLESISRGEIFIDGNLVNPILPKDRNVAMVFQNYALYPHKTVYQNIEYPLKIKKTPPDERRGKVMQAAQLLAIDHLLDRYPRQLSGGQKQRVALGRALVRRPSVYLFDEPLSNLDARLRANMRAELKLLHQNFGITFIFVTHDQVEAMTLADKIVLIKDGDIVQVGSPEEIYQRPQSIFTGTFVGSPPMNFFQISSELPGLWELAKARSPSQRPPDKLIAGIRAEAFRVAEEENQPHIEAVGILEEAIGPFYHYHFKLSSGKILNDPLIVMSGEKISSISGRRMKLFFDPDDVAYFDARSERLIA